VDEPEAIAREQDRSERGAHAVEFLVRFDVCGDRRIAFAHCGVELAEQVAAWLVVVEMGQRRDHQLGGNLAGGVAAHAVGERQQSRSRVHGVLVVRADQATVAARGVSKHEGHIARPLAFRPGTTPRVLRGVTGAARLPSCRSEPACPSEPVPP
jgi:hypothetical protein